MKLLVLIFFFISTNIFSFTPQKRLIYRTNDVISIKNTQGQKVGDWKNVFTRRINNLFSSLPGSSNNKGWEFLAEIERRNDTHGTQNAYDYTYQTLETIFNTRYIANGGITENTGAYTAAFISTSKEIDNGLGLSQFILETSFACLWFSGDGRLWSCNSLPYLKLAGINLVYNKLNKRGISLTLQDYADQNFIDTSKVDLNRGMILTRAVLPIFISMNLTRSGITSSIWDSSLTLTNPTLTNTMSDLFRLKLTDYMNELNDGIKDFYAHLFIKQFNGTPSDFFSNYTNDGAITQCENQRKEARYKILKCTNNQIMSSYLGQLMIRYMNNWNKTKSHNIFKELIEKSIYTVSNGLYYHISDYYRTNDKQIINGVRYDKPQGLTYSSLQYKILVIAAEILRNNNANLNLYTHSNKKLLKGINSLSEIMNNVPDKTSFDQHASNFKNFEYCKYLNQDASNESCRDTRTNTIKFVGQNWKRNNGFIAPVISRFCSNQATNPVENICKTETDLTAGHNHFVPKARIDNNSFLNNDLESVYMGPTQLLFLND